MSGDFYYIYIYLRCIVFILYYIILSVNFMNDTTILLPNVNENLWIDFNMDDIMDEFFWYLDHPEGSQSLVCRRNKIIKYFQQNIFFKKERELWQNDYIKSKLIDNRCKYLSKRPEELTTYDILSGFKKSAIWYGYSGFNPQLCKWFYNHIAEKYNIKTEDIICYDPCGGWGHRMIGSTEIKKYIYNDIGPEVSRGVKNMKDFFDLCNAEIHCGDAREWIPDDNYNVIFTCPPYYNIEIYECGEFKSRDEYNNLIDSLFNTFYNKESCKVFGMIIREDMLEFKWKNIADEIIPLTGYASKHLVGTADHKKKEYLYVWKKEY